MLPSMLESTTHTAESARGLWSEGQRCCSGASEPGDETEPSHRPLAPPRSRLSSASRSLAQGSREAWHSHTCLLRAEGRTVVEARASQAPAPVPRASLGFLSRLLPPAPQGWCKLIAFTPQSPGFLITWTRLLSGVSPNGRATLFLPDSSPDISRRGCNASFLLWKSQSRAPIHLATDSRPPCPPF